MLDKSFVKVYTANGSLEAEMIKMLLESEGIPSEAVQESYGIAMGLTIGQAGKADIFVPAEYEQEARKVIEAMENNSLAAPDDESNTSDHEPPA